MSDQQLPVVLVDDEEHILSSLSLYLRSVGVSPIKTIQDSREVMPFISDHAVSVVILDLFMPRLSGLKLLPEITRLHPEVPVIVVTAAQEVEKAVACMKAGAFDFLVKPVEKNRFVSTVNNAVEIQRLRRQVGSLKHHLLKSGLDQKEAFRDFVTNSLSMKSVFRYLEAVAPSSEPVLITGETGVGKEIIGGAIHQLSRPDDLFVALNVAGLDDSMFTDTLFGHRKGAFTGADQARDGVIAKAAGGTLFLDEIGELNETSQVKLLRLIQEQKYYPLGSDVPKTSKARIVAATNRDLRKMMREGLFRADLFYRLATHQVTIPPLRERKEDIPLLTSYFLEAAASSLGVEAPEPPDELLTLLSTYHFPGNVRELRAMIFDSVAQHRSGPVLSMERCRSAILASKEHAPASEVECVVAGPAIQVVGKFPTLKETEQLIIDEALRQARGNQGIAATLLGISRPALNRRLKRASGPDDR